MTQGTVVAETADFVYSGQELDALAGARNYYRWIVSRFAPFLGRRIMEVGAGIGTFTTHLLRTAPEARVLVVEPADNNFPQLARRFAAEPRVTARQGYLDDSLEPAAADSVVAVNVMEHVEDDAGFLRGAFRALKPGGHVLLLVPALPSLFGSLDRAFEHYRRYTRPVLSARLREAGFELVELRYMNLPGVAAWWLVGKVLRRRTVGPAEARLYDRWVMPVVRAVESRVAPPLGQTLLAIARKPANVEGER
jgi:SAM-dependent methyltransferase